MCVWCVSALRARVCRVTCNFGRLRVWFWRRQTLNCTTGNQRPNRRVHRVAIPSLWGRCQSWKHQLGPVPFLFCLTMNDRNEESRNTKEKITNRRLNAGTIKSYFIRECHCWREGLTTGVIGAAKVLLDRPSQSNTWNHLKMGDIKDIQRKSMNQKEKKKINKQTTPDLCFLMSSIPPRW